MSLNREKALKAFMDQEAQLVLLVFDRHGKLLEMNRFAKELMGYTTESLTYREVFLDFRQTLDFEALAQAGAEPQLLHLNTSDDQPQSLNFRFIPLDQEVLAFGQIDGHEIKGLRTNLLELSGELSNLNRELQKKNQELNRLNQLKNQFIGMAAHDLRSPIGHILTCSGFLLDDTEIRRDESRREFLEIINDSSRFMLSMIDEILDISAIESGRLELNLTDCNLRKLVQQAAGVHAKVAARRDISINLNLSTDHLALKLDEGKIRQVLDNLLSNAIKFSPERGLITLSMFNSDQDAIISVEDHGPGIPPDELNLLFQPFQKTSVPSADGSKSTGLGLAIAHRIVHGHRGRIWVESQPGKGSTFYFSVPMNLED